MQIRGLQNKILDITQMGSNFSVSIRTGQGLDDAVMVLPKEQLGALAGLLSSYVGSGEATEVATPSVPTEGSDSPVPEQSDEGSTDSAPSADVSDAGSSDDSGVATDPVSKGMMGKAFDKLTGKGDGNE